MIINDLTFAVDLLDVVEELQSQLHLNSIPLISKVMDTPDNVMICCPYHKGGQERRPSAGIKKSDGTFHCLACGETHTLQEVISHCFGHTDDMIGGFGWNWLLKNFLTIAKGDNRDVSFASDLVRGNTAVSSDVVVSEDELESYRVYHHYMWDRGLIPSVVDQFDIGYDSKTKCITFPVRNKEGQTLFVARRSVNTKYFNYPAGAEKPVYGIYELYQLPQFPREIIICESMLDALIAWVYGKYAVALNGLGTAYQFEQLNKMPCRKFILATDMDNAGLKARKRIASQLKNKLVTEYKWTYGGVKDLNDMSEEQFNQLVDTFII